MSQTPADLGLELLSPGDPRLDELVNDGVTVVDAMQADMDDLFRLEFPFVGPGTPEYQPTMQRWLDVSWSGGALQFHGTWAYFPWRRTLVHLPDQGTFFRMRTNRNRDLITCDEQRAYYEASVAIAGLSVGSSCATAIALTGGAGRLRIADFDVLSMTNLNRLPGSVCDIGRPKTELSARRLLEMNPYLDLRIWPEGLQVTTLHEFLGEGNERVDVFVEEIDDVFLKIQARVVARELGLPVVMATDNGDNAIIDVERFDLERGRPLFHGRVAEDRLLALPPMPSPGQRVAVANGIVGSCVTTRTQDSLQKIGSQLVTWPQLGTAAMASGAAVAFVVRQIIIGAEMPSGRYHVDLDAVLDPTLSTAEGQSERQRKTRDFETSVETLFGAL